MYKAKQLFPAMFIIRKNKWMKITKSYESVRGRRYDGVCYDGHKEVNGRFMHTWF